MVFWYTRWDGQRFCSENDYGESKQNSNKLDKVTSYIAESNRKQQITYSDPRNKCYLTKCPECGEEVYFVRHNGGTVWFDDLGQPWPKHPCFLSFGDDQQIKFLNQTALSNIYKVYKDHLASKLLKNSEIKRKYLSTLPQENDDKYLGIIKSVEHCSMEVPKSKIGSDLFASFQRSLKLILKIGLPRFVWDRIKTVLMSEQTSLKNLDVDNLSRKKILLIEKMQSFLDFFNRNPDIFISENMRKYKNPLAQLHFLISMKNPYPTIDLTSTKPKFRSDRKNVIKNPFSLRVIYSELKVDFAISTNSIFTIRIHGHIDLSLVGELCYFAYGILVVPQRNKIFNAMSWKA